MKESKENKDRINVVVEPALRRKLDGMPKNLEYGPFVRAALHAWLDNRLLMDEDGHITLASDTKHAVQANEKTVKIVKGFAKIVAKPADKRTRIENMLVLNAEEATGIDFEN